MAERAHVSSVEAIEDFRASLVVYIHRIRPLVEEVGADLRRMQDWLENDQRVHWDREVRRRSRALEEAQQALLSARIATFREVTVLEQAAVHAARRHLEEAQDKQRRLRHWSREFGPRTESLARQVAVLDTVLSQDMARAVAWLSAAIQHLAAYAEMRHDLAPPVPVPVPPPDAVDAAPASAPPVDAPAAPPPPETPSP